MVSCSVIENCRMVKCPQWCQQPWCAGLCVALHMFGENTKNTGTCIIPKKGKYCMKMGGCLYIRIKTLLIINWWVQNEGRFYPEHDINLELFSNFPWSSGETWSCTKYWAKFVL